MTTETTGDPVAALREIGFWLERRRSDTHRVKAYRRAADAVEAMPAAERAERERDRSWGKVVGIGPKTAAVIAQAVAGEVPAYLAEMRAGSAPLASGGAALRAELRGDLHTHSTWSDGGSPLTEMMATGERLGHRYMVATDHSPRLKIARGLTPERLREQLAAIDRLNAEIEADGRDFRVLKGIEVDILEDGTLDQESALLAELDVVVASVHSHLRSDPESMTRRMVAAIADPRVNVLGHCTGRLVEGDRGTRPESQFDAEVVFAACREYDTAVEINSRPERRDPPRRLVELAIETGCLFSIDTDAHAPGQLDFLDYGCERATEIGVQPANVINTWELADLLDWCRS